MITRSTALTRSRSFNRMDVCSIVAITMIRKFKNQVQKLNTSASSRRYMSGVAWERNPIEHRMRNSLTVKVSVAAIVSDRFIIVTP